MSRFQRDKGARRERELINLHRSIGVQAERVPLSSVTAYQGRDHDIDIYPFGPDQGALAAEVKARGGGDGFKTLERWLGDNDVMFLVRDRHAPPVVLPWWVWGEIVERLKSMR